MTKAWRIAGGNHTFEVVRADTAGKARAKSEAYDDGWYWCELRVKRVPQMDGEGDLTARDYIKAGYTYSCRLCEAMVSAADVSDGGGFDHDGDVYCPEHWPYARAYKAID